MVISSTKIRIWWCEMWCRGNVPLPWQGYWLAPCLRLSWKCQTEIAHSWEQGCLHALATKFRVIPLRFVFSFPFPSLLPVPGMVPSSVLECFWMTTPPRDDGVNCCSGSGSKVGLYKCDQQTMWHIRGLSWAPGTLQSATQKGQRQIPPWEQSAFLSLGRFLQP